MGVKAEPSPAGSTAKRAFWAGRWMACVGRLECGDPGELEFF
jgi:hypothetical protein